jgi:hypothetical protein
MQTIGRHVMHSSRSHMSLMFAVTFVNNDTVWEQRSSRRAVCTRVKGLTQVVAGAAACVCGAG